MNIICLNMERLIQHACQKPIQVLLQMQCVSYLQSSSTGYSNQSTSSMSYESIENNRIWPQGKLPAKLFVAS